MWRRVPVDAGLFLLQYRSKVSVPRLRSPLVQRIGFSAFIRSGRDLGLERELPAFRQQFGVLLPITQAFAYGSLPCLVAQSAPLH